jgi:hypothetical protein
MKRLPLPTFIFVAVVAPASFAQIPPVPTDGLEHVAQLYREAGKQLTLITIDEDEEAKAATEFLKMRAYQWLNMHDSGDIGKALGEGDGIPRAILIDAQGKVIFDELRNDAEVRKAIAKLGPEYASFAPKKSPTPPCTTEANAR